MTVAQIADRLNMKIVAGESNKEREIKGVYICDLLSWVMSHANDDDLWITVLTNLNTVAVAMLANVACVVIPEDIEVEEETINKANEEGVVMLRSELPSFDICIKTYELLKNGGI